MGSAWTNRYDITQEYDKNGNRTRFHQNTAAGHTADYGPGENLSYTYNDVNALTSITDSDDANYVCTVTCDANGNITQVVEQDKTVPQTASLTTDYTYDALNRLTRHKTTKYDGGEGQTDYWQRDHVIDAIGRVAKSTYQFVQGGIGQGAV